MRARVRLYGLYERPRNAKGQHWTRLVPHLALPKLQAVRMFQSALLAPFLQGLTVERRLRPVLVAPDDDPLAVTPYRHHTTASLRAVREDLDA